MRIINEKKIEEVFEEVFKEVYTENKIKSMRIIKEANDNQFAVVLIGGSIGEKRVSRLNQLAGMKIMDSDLFSINQAKEKANRMNKLLSPGEKKYYGLKYVVAEVENGKYTGK